MIPELVISMLACARIGAIHNVVFAGFSAQALKERIQDSKSKLIITADKGCRGGRMVPLKENADAIVHECPTVEKMIVIRRIGDINMEPKRDFCGEFRISKTTRNRLYSCLTHTDARELIYRKNIQLELFDERFPVTIYADCGKKYVLCGSKYRKEHDSQLLNHLLEKGTRCCSKDGKRG